MFSLKTNRLELFPLHLSHLKLLQESRTKLEKHLGWQISNMKMADNMVEDIESAIQHWIDCIGENPTNYQWNTSWEIFLEKEKRSIGTMGFNGIPNELGETVVGYSIDNHYHNQGYMTEALTELVAWAELNPRLKRIIAETDQDNLSSQRVLKKVGFEELGIFEERNTLIFGKMNW